MSTGNVYFSVENIDMWGGDIVSENLGNHKAAERRLVELISNDNTKCGTLNQNDGRIWLKNCRKTDPNKEPNHNIWTTIFLGKAA